MHSKAIPERASHRAWRPVADNRVAIGRKSGPGAVGGVELVRKVLSVERELPACGARLEGDACIQDAIPALGSPSHVRRVEIHKAPVAIVGPQCQPPKLSYGKRIAASGGHGPIWRSWQGGSEVEDGRVQSSQRDQRGVDL